MLEVFLKRLTSNNQTKPFYVTSEFWVFVGAEVTTLAGWLPTHNPEVRTIVAGVAAGAYKLSRGLAKSGTKPAPTP
jgi:hypothetical protein